MFQQLVAYFSGYPPSKAKTGGKKILKNIIATSLYAIMLLIAYFLDFSLKLNNLNNINIYLSDIHLTSCSQFMVGYQPKITLCSPGEEGGELLRRASISKDSNLCVKSARRGNGKGIHALYVIFRMSMSISKL